jgi:hypothetical protein
MPSSVTILSTLSLVLGILCVVTFALGGLNMHALIGIVSVASLYILECLVVLVKIYTLPSGARKLTARKFLYKISLAVTLSILAISASILALVLESPPAQLEYAFLAIGVCSLLVFILAVT